MGLLAACIFLMMILRIRWPGARPLGFLLALALPREVGPAWLEPFARGLGEDRGALFFPALGGDTDCTPGPLTISIAALGAVPHGKMVRRSGARPGDRVVVTGTIGDAALGVLLRRDSTMADGWNSVATIRIT
jgi:thiamine-monophosphate kinase